MLLLLYLNVVLKVNDVVLGCCLSVVRTALVKSQGIVMILHTSWSLSGHSNPVTARQ